MAYKITFWDAATGTQQERDATPEEGAEIAARLAGAPAQAAEAQRLSGVDDAIAGDATIQTLRAMTVAEFDTWWAANVTTLAQANNVLKRIARVVLRRVL